MQTFHLVNVCSQVMLGGFSFISEGNPARKLFAELPNLNFLWAGKEEDLLMKKVPRFRQLISSIVLLLRIQCTREQAGLGQGIDGRVF